MQVASSISDEMQIYRGAAYVVGKTEEKDYCSYLFTVNLNQSELLQLHLFEWEVIIPKAC